MPAVELRAFMNSGSPARRRSSFTRSKLAFGMKISPRTSRTAGTGVPAGGARTSGTASIARTLRVTSSPVAPSPRVAARTRPPRS